MEKKAQRYEKMKEISNELKDYSFEERFHWMLQKKLQGNRQFQKGNYPEALDIYMDTMFGLAEYPEPERNKKINFELKVPLLNNIAACMLSQKNYSASLNIIDQVIRKKSDINLGTQN